MSTNDMAMGMRPSRRWNFDPKPEPEHLALLLSVGAYGALPHYGAATKEEAWDMLDDLQCVVVLSQNADLWTEGFEHELVGFVYDTVPGVPEGWRTYLWAVDSHVAAMFTNYDGTTEQAACEPSELSFKQAAYTRFLEEPKAFAADLWKLVETRRQAAA